MNALRYGRQSACICMILFFTAGAIGVITNNALAVKAGFALSIMSSPVVIFMTFKLRKDVDE